MARLLSWASDGAGDERPDRPFTGYKLAHAVLSADGSRAGFAGLTLGAHNVYGATADAMCVWNKRHVPPRRWCGCGFYCLHTLADARSLACATENRSALLLQVAASGSYIRYERGLRYSRQRVRAVLDAQCSCGRPGTALGDAGSGLIGWRHLAPVCARCTAGRPVLSLWEFTSRLDTAVRVTGLLSASPLSLGPLADQPLADGALADGALADGLLADGPAPGDPLAAGHRARIPAARDPRPGAPGTGTAESPDAADQPSDPGESPLAVLAAEIALLHARLDDLQSRLER
jgi:hypothetical protein